MNFLKKTFDSLEKILTVIVGIGLMVMTASIFYQVILRYIFSTSVIWAEELARFSWAWVTFLGTAIAIRKKSHLKVGILIDKLDSKKRSILQIILYIISLVLLSVIFLQGIELVSGTMNTTSPGLGLPMGIPYGSILVGSLFMILFVVEQIFNEWRDI